MVPNDKFTITDSVKQLMGVKRFNDMEVGSEASKTHNFFQKSKSGN